MAGRRSREELRDDIRGRRANGAVGGTKLANLQDEAAQLLAQSGLEAPPEETVLSPGEEAEQESRQGGIVTPTGQPARARRAPQTEDDVLEAAKRIMEARAEQARRPKQPEAPNSLLLITLQAQAFFEKQGYKADTAAQLSLAYAILEASNVLVGWRDRMFPPTR